MDPLETYAHTVACGQAHTCAITQKDQLYVWGEKVSSQLFEKKDDRQRDKEKDKDKKGSVSRRHAWCHS